MFGKIYNRLIFVLVCLSCTMFCCDERYSAKVGDVVTEDMKSYMIVFFATWDAESVLRAKTVGRQFLDCDSTILVALDTRKTITEEVMMKEKLELYYDTLIFDYEAPHLKQRFLSDEDVEADNTVYFVKDGRVRMKYQMLNCNNN